MSHAENDAIHIIARNFRSVGQLGGFEFRPLHELVARNFVELSLFEVTEAGALRRASGSVYQQSDLDLRLLNANDHVGWVIAGAEPPGGVGRPNGTRDFVTDSRHLEPSEAKADDGVQSSIRASPSAPGRF